MINIDEIAVCLQRLFQTDSAGHLLHIPTHFSYIKTRAGQGDVQCNGLSPSVTEALMSQMAHLALSCPFEAPIAIKGLEHVWQVALKGSSIYTTEVMLRDSEGRALKTLSALDASKFLQLVKAEWAVWEENMQVALRVVSKTHANGPMPLPENPAHYEIIPGMKFVYPTMSLPKNLCSHKR